MNRQDLKMEVIHAIVKSVSLLGTCRRSKVGAVIVRDGRIISTGHNGSPPGELHCLDVGCDMRDGHCIRTTHAEANAIAFAARYGIATAGATIYVYGWITGGDLGICHACNKLAKSAGILKTVIVPLSQEASAGDFERVSTFLASKSRDHSCQESQCRIVVSDSERRTSTP